ncbi:hypothetical protein LH935_28330 (plasmid) [Gordonia polyisoprenivorans]|uniref:hypothetical protein n=1 Tax=Gordonia polyisoprenivorans TaxID=84595 RepID=UPI002234A0B4|nr:hypothetical protein LH935_28330 [Gordonia polyisoprenivorans]
MTHIWLDTNHTAVTYHRDPAAADRHLRPETRHTTPVLVIENAWDGDGIAIQGTPEQLRAIAHQISDALDEQP